MTNGELLLVIAVLLVGIIMTGKGIYDVIQWDFENPILLTYGVTIILVAIVILIFRLNNEAAALLENYLKGFETWWETPI